MFNTIKVRLQDINNRVNLGMSKASTLYQCNTKYFVEIINKKNERERFYVDKEDFTVFENLNENKRKAILKLRAKQKLEKKKAKVKNK